MRDFRGLPLLLLVLLATACSSDDGAEKKAPKLDGVIHQTVFDEDSKVVPGVEVCVVGHKEIPCATTDDLGIADLAVPLNAELVLSYEKTDFVTKHRFMFSDESLATGLNTWIFQRKTWYDSLAADLGGAIDYSRGMIGLETVAMAGATFALEPNAGIKGPVQFMLYQGKLAVCPPAGATCEAGVSGFFDVPPGKYQATFSAPGKTCTPKAFACADGTPSCMELDVQAGVLSFGYMRCE